MKEGTRSGRYRSGSHPEIRSKAGVDGSPTFSTTECLSRTTRTPRRSAPRRGFPFGRQAASERRQSQTADAARGNANARNRSFIETTISDRPEPMHSRKATTCIRGSQTMPSPHWLVRSTIKERQRIRATRVPPRTPDLLRGSLACADHRVPTSTKRTSEMRLGLVERRVARRHPGSPTHRRRGQLVSSPATRAVRSFRRHHRALSTRGGRYATERNDIIGHLVSAKAYLGGTRAEQRTVRYRSRLLGMGKQSRDKEISQP